MSHWTSIKVSGKLTEVKDVINPKTKSHLIDDQAELHACLRIDNNSDLQFQTAPLTSAFPLWAEDFEFYLKHGFREIEVVVWGTIHSLANMSSTEVVGTQMPIGKVFISKNAIKSNEETWYSLRDASLESKVSGKINLKIEHFPPNLQRKIHGFSVTVLKALDLYSPSPNSINPFVVLHMVPDLDALTAETTSVKQSTNNPLYSEAFFFSCDEGHDPRRKILFASVWDKSAQGEINFLGLCEIPLAPVMIKGATNRWYSLSALSDDSLYTKPAKNKNGDNGAPARELIKELQKVDPTVRVRKSHTFKEKNVALAKCLHCSHKMVGVQLVCSQCHLYCHHKCREDAGFSCGGNGSIRMTLAIEKSTVLSLDDYYDFISLLQSNRYEMILSIGKELSEKQEISKYCQSIFGNQFFDFLVLAIQSEIRGSDSTKTLFRGNTLASKAIYIFMTQIGMDYLHSTLGQTLQTIINSKAACEIDVNKVDDPGSITKNLESLINYLDLVLRAIFNSLPQMPAALRELFKIIQTEACKKFPEDNDVRYTSVTGFLFLRFLVPTILNPKQFGIDADSSSRLTKRKLMLIGKTLQNLANLICFEKKEDTMLVLNSFLTERMLGLRNFLDQLLEPEISGKAVLTTSFDPTEIALDVARLYKVLVSNKETLTKIRDYDTLEKVLRVIEDKVKSIEKNMIIDPLDDTGIDLEESVLGSVDTPHGNAVSEKVEKLRNLNMSTPNLTILLMGGTITGPNLRKRSLRIDESDLRKLVSEKHSQPINDIAKLMSIREASVGSFLNLNLPAPIPLNFMENSRGSAKNSEEHLPSSSSPLPVRQQHLSGSSAISKKHISLQGSLDAEKEKQSLQKLMQETSNLRIVVREQEKQFQKQLAIFKEEQSQELQKWKIDSSAIVRNEIMEQNRIAKLVEESRVKRESGITTSSKEDKEQRLLAFQINEDLLKLRKIVEERGTILAELAETQRNQNDNIDHLHSEISNFDLKVKNIDEDLSKRIETFVDAKLSKRQSQQLSQPLQTQSYIDIAVKKALSERMKEFEKEMSIQIQSRVREITMQFKSETSYLKEFGSGHIAPNELEQFRRDLNRIEDVASQALNQIQTLSRRYYYASKDDAGGESSAVKRSSILNPEPPPSGANVIKRPSLRGDYPISTESSAISSVQQRTSMLLNNSYANSRDIVSRRPEQRESNLYPEGSNYRPRESLGPGLTPTPPTNDSSNPRKNRISAIITSGHVRERLKSFEEPRKEEVTANRKSYLVSRRT